MKVRILNSEYYDLKNHYSGKIYEAEKHGLKGLIKVKIDEDNSSIGWLAFKEEWVQPIDTIVESVINQFRERSEVGIEKYGVTLDREDLSSLEWISHAQQEAMDFCLYLEKLKQTL